MLRRDIHEARSLSSGMQLPFQPPRVFHAHECICDEGKNRRDEPYRKSVREENVKIVCSQCSNASQAYSGRHLSFLVNKQVKTYTLWEPGAVQRARSFVKRN
jgi:hypothetical protein